MNMLKAATAAIMGLVCAASASATDYPFTFTAGTYLPTPAPITVGGPTVYTDTFRFTTTTAGLFSGTLGTSQITDPDTGAVLADLDFVSIFLDSTAWSINNPPASVGADVQESRFITNSAIGAGDHTIFVNYTVDPASASNGGRYGGAFSYSEANVAAVPEPASWAMMVGGFGLLGGAMRRKRVVEAAAYL